MNYKDDCIFCKIAQGQIKSSIVYEDSEVLAFLDVNPVSNGHTLVITKEHFDNFLMVPKDLLDHVFNVAQKVAQAQTQQLGAKGINILTNVNEIAGQTIKHFHVHVIPRYEGGDGLTIDFEPSCSSRYHKERNIKVLYTTLIYSLYSLKSYSLFLID